MKVIVDQLAVEVWQSLHAAVVVTWPAGFPGAVVPLWQLAQVPVTAAWLNRTADQLVVEVWQSLHAAVVVTWPEGLPGASVPL